MLAFVTVGSTRFDALVQAATSEEALSALKTKGYTHVIIQCGNSDFELGQNLVRGQTRQVYSYGVQLELWRFQPSLQDVVARADLVISHAGSGTILDVLRTSKALIAVPNLTLLDNHQEELAVALSELGYLKSSTIPCVLIDVFDSGLNVFNVTVRGLAQAIRDLDRSQIVPFPEFDASKFRSIVDEEMGF